MITVPEATEKIIKRSRYLHEALSKGIINNSSLARYIKPEIEQLTYKTTSNASIIMALNRLSKELKAKQKKPINALKAPDISIKSDIFEVVVGNSNGLSAKREKIFLLKEDNTNTTIVLVGKNQTSILAPRTYRTEILDVLKNEDILFEKIHLSAITVRLTKGTLETPGVFYSILKSFAWEEINIIDIFSTYLDFTIVIEEKNVEEAFNVIKSIFSSGKEII